MDEDFNMSMRKFLKQVGVTSQQAIEEAMRGRGQDGGKGGGPFAAHVVLTVPGLDLTHEVNGTIQAPDAGAGFAADGGDA